MAARLPDGVQLNGKSRVPPVDHNQPLAQRLYRQVSRAEAKLEALNREAPEQLMALAGVAFGLAFMIGIITFQTVLR